MIVEAGNKANNDIAFTWILTDYCQYDCAYCCSVDINKDKMTQTKIWKFVLARLKKLDITFKISLLGGEPTLHENLIEIIEELYKMPNCISIDLITNFQKPNAFFEKLNIFQSPKFEMTISYHSEYHKGFLEKLHSFKPTYTVDVSVCVYNKHLDKCKFILDNSQFNAYPTFLFDTSEWSNPINIPEDFKEYFVAEDSHEESVQYIFENETINYTNHEIFEQKLNRFKGYKCKRLMYRINANGNFVDVCDNSMVGILPTKESLLKYKPCVLNECVCAEYFSFHKVKQ